MCALAQTRPVHKSVALVPAAAAEPAEPPARLVAHPETCAQPVVSFVWARPVRFAAVPVRLVATIKAAAAALPVVLATLAKFVVVLARSVAMEISVAMELLVPMACAKLAVVPAKRVALGTLAIRAVAISAIQSA